MTRSFGIVWTGLVLLPFCWIQAGEPAKPQPSGRTYLLRYKFKPGESVRWRVVHRAKVETTVSGTTQTAETFSSSVKLWRVIKVEPDGTATFEHLVESVDMRQKLSGRQEIRYNSQTDDQPPAEFAPVAESIGVCLSVITLDPTGRIVSRQRKPAKASVESEGQITIPLPKEAVPVGHRWSFPYPIDVPLESGGIKRVQTLQQFALEDVKTGVATISVATHILTPIDDPAIQAQLVQRESSGTVRFDIDAGRILSQQMDLDKRVVGFRGPASSLHYATRFTEELLTKAVETANSPKPAAK